VSSAVQQADYAHLLSPAALATTLSRDDTEPWRAFPHHRMLSRELVSLHSRNPGQRRNLMVMMPPRHGKSELSSHWFPVWNFALDPATNIILCSYSQELASKFSRQVRRTIRDHYPLIGTRLLEDSRAAHRWETNEGGGIYATGIGGGISGRGANVLILDDPVKDAEAANSQVIRDNTWDWWETTFLSRRAPDAIIVLIMTRWHEDDVAGRLLDREPELWEVLRLPALAEENDPLGRPEGEPLWPVGADGETKFDLDFMLTTKRRGSRSFNALYQQRPTSPEGLGIERSWWRWYDESPQKIAEMCDYVIQTWDPTFKDTDSSDFVAGFVLGRMGHKVFMLDGIREHLNAPKTIRAIRDMRRKWPMGKRILIEEAASGPAIIQMLEQELPGIMPIRARGSKTVRLHWGVSSVAGFIEDGNVYLPRKHEVADHLVAESAAFPHGAHDDLVDAMTQGVQFLIPQGWAALKKWGREIAEEVDEGRGFIQQHKRSLLRAIQNKINEQLKNKATGHDMPGW
jgi:predicted phage terminase large subunit-like protein